MQTGSTEIYLVCFHSAKPETFKGSTKQYRIVETAIGDEKWPYDNGDDPSFYVARRGGLLTWGVCRQDLRNAIVRGSIVVFFSFTPLEDDRIQYRLCAIETVTGKVDHRAIHVDRRFTKFRDLYINGLISPENDSWRYQEDDRRSSQKHKDWLWRMANHQGATRKKFDSKHSSIYRDGCFSNDAVVRGELKLGGNYVVFSTPPDRAFISPNPPEVAMAKKGEHETWSHKTLKKMTVCKAASLHPNERDYLRVKNPTERNVHRQIRFRLPSDEAHIWRDALIKELKAATECQRTQTTIRLQSRRTIKC